MGAQCAVLPELLDERRLEVARHAAHRHGAEGLAAHVLQHVVEFPCARTGGAKAGMHNLVEIGLPQRQPVGPPARAGRGACGERRRDRRQEQCPRLRTGSGCGAGDLEPPLAGQRSRGLDQHALEALLERGTPLGWPLVHTTFRLVTASGNSVPKARWKNSATAGRSSSSHLLRKLTRKARPMSAKIAAFSAQVMTVRGLITVEMSPFMKALRVMSATRTIAMIVRRPSASS